MTPHIMDPLIIIYIAITILFAAFFSGMEAAFISFDQLRFEMNKKEGSLPTRILDTFLKAPNTFISVMITGYSIALIAYCILITQYLQQAPVSQAIRPAWLLAIVQTAIAAFVILVAGRLIPQIICKANPNLSLKASALPLYFFYKILRPVSKSMSALSRLILKLFRVKIDKEATEKAFTKIDLDHLIQNSIENANEEGVNEDVRIFQNALDFSNVKIKDCMIPRTEIVAVKEQASIEELKAKFIESGISKIIVCKDNIDNIVGYIHSAEMFRAPEKWTDRIQQIPIVPETMPAHKLLQLFMQKKKTLAIVVDEFGGTSGLVSLEDLVEEIFGDIEDEHDTTSYTAKQTAPHEYLLSARLEIEKINEMFNLGLPESDDYQTIGGLILNQYQNIPKLHEVIRIRQYEFKIIKMTTTKIELVKLKVME